MERSHRRTDAIYDEFLRQASSTSNGRVELLAVASVGRTVFVERRDLVTIEGKDVAVHVTGVFEVDDEGKIVAWRDYFDSREIATKVGRPPSGR
jgi:limonene-1,2-epoxide hydrolase